MIIAIIQARLGSSRLPGKILKEVNGKALFAYQLERLKHAKKVDRIVIATTNKDGDAPIQTFCEQQKLMCYRGDEHDVLDRYYQAAVAAGLKKDDVVVRLTSDCPLIDPRVVDEVIEKYLSGHWDYVANTVPPPGTYPDGMDVEVFSFAMLERAWVEAKKPSEREHVTFYFWRGEQTFKTHQCNFKTDWSQYRLTVDYEEDFLLMKNIIQHFGDKIVSASMEDIIAFLESNQHACKINQQIQRNQGWNSAFEKDKQC